MHYVEYLKKTDEWIVKDCHGKEAFRGTKEECLEWLTSNEGNVKNPWRSFLQKIVKK